VSFCGLSLGGGVGQWLALHAPERIDRLVLACTSARFGVPENWLKRAATVRAEGLDVVADAILQLWFTPQTHRDQPELVRRYRAMMVSADPAGYAGCCEALAAWDPGPALGAITAPTLVVAGSEDPATPPAQAEAIRDVIPGARLHVLQGAGHLANVEQPEAFGRLLLEHLTAQSVVETSA
jgi:3-oxoadipate enol-lactonase